MIKKAFSNQKEITQFKKEYSTSLNIEVISNMLQPYYQDEHPEIKNYCNFLYPEDKILSRMTGLLQLILITFDSKALEEKFGKYDFTFTGNRKYKNYVLEFDGLTIIAPEKRSVVLKDPENAELRIKLIEFEKAYSQMVIDYIFQHYDELPDFQQESLDKIKNAGIIDSNNQIDFNYHLKSKTSLKI